MFEGIKNLKNLKDQRLRGDTPWRVGLGFLVTGILALMSVSIFNILFFVVAYFWTQSWSYAGHYRSRKFRPNFMRILMEFYWPFKKAAMKREGALRFFFVSLTYLIPLLFCFGLMIFAGGGNYFIPLLGVGLGALMNQKFSEDDPSLLDESKNVAGFESEEALNEFLDPFENHQKDSEKDL